MPGVRWKHLNHITLMVMTYVLFDVFLQDVSASSSTTKDAANVSEKSNRHERIIRQVENLASEQHVESRRQCTHSSRERRHAERSPRYSRYEIRSANRGDVDFGMALYFTGQSDHLRRSVKNPQLSRVDYPTEQFSVELWVKPEGGQKSPAVVIGFSDTCHSTYLGHDVGWALGIKGSDQDSSQNARFFFSLYTDRSREATVITSHKSYQPNTWVHLAATYNGQKMKLYINGAMVASSVEKSGPIFHVVTQECKQLVLGGSLLHDASYRGALDELTIWSESRGHSAIKDSMSNNRARNSGHPSNIIREDFDYASNEERGREWEAVGDNIPLLIHSDIPNQMHDLSLRVPPCGVTVCDNPTVMQSYINRNTLRKSKTLRYQAVSIANDDGSFPTVTHEQVIQHHREINEAFNPHNITWEMSEMVVRNSSLRRRVVLHSCHASDIGNSKCNIECRHAVTGNDGGDCDEVDSECDISLLGDGKCDPACNKAYHGWDEGDCCDPFVTNTNLTCFDPVSHLRSYMTIEELKHVVHTESNEHLNIFFVNFDDTSIEGFATMPWETEALGILGGSVLQADCCNTVGSADSIIHEMGHNLGLWHVHEGVSAMDCSDECWEKEPSLELGDLIADTNPTPENMECRDPQPCDNYATCGFEEEEYNNTPYRNYMSYADHDCTDHFSFQQSARMHCYIDLFYSSWRSDDSPIAAIPLPPHIISEQFSEHLNDHSVTLAWVPPLHRIDSFSSNSGEVEFACNDCKENNVLLQYATTAEAYGSRDGREFRPERATGPPDAETCDGSKFSWVAWPNNDGMSTTNICILELGFTTPVIPARLSMWVNYIGEGIQDIELLLIDGQTISLGPVEVFCDVPFTTLLPDIVVKLDKVRIHAKRYLSVDSVLIESKPHHQDCLTCVQPSYSIQRTPAFSTGSKMVVRQNHLIDWSVEPDIDYTYSVRAVLDDGEESDPSPPLHFRLGQSFCGNGYIDSESGEECDDGNALDGDGCNMECRVEAHFKCSGKPSLCYRFTSDGICEDFERQDSVEDCGYNTPSGYRDQWATSARANPDYQSKSCPASTVKGDPGPSQICHTSIDNVHNAHAWYPCHGNESRTDYWLKVRFMDPVVATSVIVHLGADGFYPNSGPKRVSVTLIGPDGVRHTQPAKDVAVSCSENPVHFNILHDLSKPFFYTQEVVIDINSFEVAISAVRLRSWKTFDPVEIRQCAPGDVYNPATEKCAEYTCRKPRCEKFRKRYAEVNCTGFTDGDICRVQCLRGYVPQGPSTHQCIEGEWTGSNVPCKPIDCDRPDILYATANCPEGTTYGGECTFKCQSPAKLQGTSNTMITCQADGMFSLPESFCQLRCDSAPDAANAELQTTSCMRAGPHIVGSSCTYMCSPGYHVAGQAHTKRTLRYTCGVNSQWEGHQCIPIVCPEPPSVFHGLYNCTDSFKLNSVCRLNCPDEDHNEQNLITCTADGTWDGQFTMCPSFTGMCQEPEAMENDVIIHCDKQNPIGILCSVSCTRNRYSQVVHAPGINLNDVTYATSVQHLTCTGQLQWYPDPSRLTCANACDPNSMADGFCDEMNNRAYCNWDGGDCCSSTCAQCSELYNGEVTPWPKFCTDACQCFDPNAKENIVSDDGRTSQPRRKHI